MHERHIDLPQQSRHGLRSAFGVLHNQPEQVRHVLEGVPEPGDFRQLFGPPVRRRDNVQRGQLFGVRGEPRRDLL